MDKYSPKIRLQLYPRWLPSNQRYFSTSLSKTRQSARAPVDVRKILRRLHSAPTRGIEYKVPLFRNLPEYYPKYDAPSDGGPENGVESRGPESEFGRSSSPIAVAVILRKLCRQLRASPTKVFALLSARESLRVSPSEVRVESEPDRFRPRSRRGRRRLKREEILRDATRESNCARRDLL